MIYGMSITKWERQNEERDWRCLLQFALATYDYDLIEDLIVEGISENYSFPTIWDTRVKKLITALID